MNLKDVEERQLVKEFLTFTNDMLKIKSPEVLEKDFYLTIFLSEVKNETLIFKGGTCLAKVYLNYHRFSEDLDFTWKKQEIFKNKTMKQIRKVCSGLIDEIGTKIKDISKKYGFDFEFEKDNRNYVEIGGGSKIVTFKIWYNSVLTEMKSFFKIQVNFLENIKFQIKREKLNNLIKASSFSENERKYFKDFLDFYRMSPAYNIYDINEIACEKIRSILTRRGMKTRDVLDLYLIKKNFGVDFEKIKHACNDKIIFSIKMYKKYKENFNKIVSQSITKEEISAESVEHLLLTEIDEKDFDNFLEEFLSFLNGLIMQIEGDEQ